MNLVNSVSADFKVPSWGWQESQDSSDTRSKNENYYSFLLNSGFWSHPLSSYLLLSMHFQLGKCGDSILLQCIVNEKKQSDIYVFNNLGDMREPGILEISFTFTEFGSLSKKIPLYNE